MEKAQRPELIWPSSSPSSQSRASSDSSLQLSTTPSPLSLAKHTSALPVRTFMDDSKQSPLFEGYLTTLYDQSPQKFIPGHDPVRLQYVFAPINLYVITDTVTSSCIPNYLYLSVLL